MKRKPSKKTTKRITRLEAQIAKLAAMVQQIKQELIRE